MNIIKRSPEAVLVRLQDHDAHGTQYIQNNEIYALLGYYAASGNSLPTFFLDFMTLEDGRPIGCPEASARNYHSTLLNNPEELRSRLLHG
jgi:hypothetical protein